jgi:hypothetical protein
MLVSVGSVLLFTFILYRFCCLFLHLVNSLSQNYIFASLTKEDLDQVAATMDIVSVSQGENIVTQGKLHTFKFDLFVLYILDLYFFTYAFRSKR